MKTVQKRNRYCTAFIVAALWAFGSLAHAASVNVWLDDGAHATGSTSAGQAFSNSRDATWDVTATQENGLSELGAAVMSIRLLSFNSNGDSRESTTGGGNGLTVRSGSNNFWMDALNNEGTAFQLKFYSDVAKTTEITDLDITFKSLVTRTANSNLAVNAYAGSGALAISGDGTNDTDTVSLGGTDMVYASDSSNSFAEETDLVPSGYTNLNFYTVTGSDAITFSEEDTFWIRRSNLNDAADNAYQVANLTFEIVPKPAEVSVWLDDGAHAPGSTSTNQAYANLRDATWDVTATQENGLSDIGAAVMSIRLLSFNSNGDSRESTTGGGNGLTVRSGSNNFWMDAFNYEGAAVQLTFFSDANKTTEITGLDITFKSLMARTANANLAINAYAGSGVLAISGAGTTDSDTVSVGGNNLIRTNDSVIAFAEDTDLIPSGFTALDFYTISGSGAVSFSENDTFWLRRYNLNSAADTAYQLANLTFSVKAIDGYYAWASSYHLAGGPSGDDDQDGLSNIHEYGVGGDPTDALNQGTSPEFSIVNSGGGNVFSYVYPQRSGSGSELSYTLELNTNLVSGVWTNAGYAVMGTNVTGGSLDFVTNVTDTAEDQKFIRLVIE
jgi:hypothetical protein